jgi:glycine/D-amino acid oxidase-like deaminating enzyme
MTQSPDVIIVGAGIVGAACAYELAQAGARVEVIDSGIPGGGATAAGMGHLVVLDDNEAELALTKLSVGLWRSLSKQLPPAAEFWSCGTLWIAADEVELAGAKAKLDVYGRHGLAAELLDERQLYEAEPNLRKGLAGGLVAKDDAVVYAPVATRFLLDQAKAKVTRATVTNLDDLKAGVVVCATGSMAPSLVPGLAVRPRKGHLAITDRYPGFARHQLVELGYLQSAHGESSESVAFNVQPRPTGQLLIGSSRQYGVETTCIDAPILARMLQRAFGYMPGLRSCSVIRTWTGFRASTPDKLPIIGKLRGNIYLATGHEGLGVTTSLGTAKILAAEILGRPSPIPPGPYRVERFDD